MKYCENCFAINEDSDVVCISCGTPLSPSSPAPTARKWDWRILWIAIAAVLVVGLGIFIGKTVFSSRNKLENACLKTLNVVQEQLAPNKRSKTVWEEATALLQSQSFTASIGYRTDGQELRLDTDYSRKDKALRGSAAYYNPGDGISLGLDYSIASNVLQISAPDLSGSVYGCNVKKLGNILGNSKLASLLPVSVPKDFGTSIFKKTTIQDTLKSYGGEHYEELHKSVEQKKLSDQVLSLGGRQEKVSVYKVTWSSHAFTEFISHAWGSKVFSALGQMVNSLIPEVDSSCLLYVSKSGYLMGFDFVSLGTKYQFLLEGQDNPWELFSLRVTSLYNDPVVYTGSTVVQGGVLLMELKNEQEVFASLAYSSITGDFSVRTAKRGELLRGNLVRNGSTLGATVLLVPEYGSAVELSCQLSPLAQTPKALSNDYFDLLDMSLADWQRFLLEQNIQIF